MVAQSKLSFPLLKLPWLAILEVLKEIDLDDLMILSLLSSEMKILVKKVRVSDARPVLKIRRDSYEIEEYDELQIGNWNHFDLHYPQAGSPFSVLFIDRYLGYMNVSKKNFTYQDYIRHFLDVTNSSGIVLDLGNIWESHPLEHYLNLLRGIKVEAFSIYMRPPKTFVKVLEGFFDVMELELQNEPKDAHLIKKVSDHDFDRLALDFPIKLEQLLRIKSRNVKVAQSLLDSNDLKRLVNAWLNYEINPSLQSLHLFNYSCIYDDISPEDVLEGIRYEKIKPKKGTASVRFYSNGGHETQTITDGFIISRGDGRKAVIDLNEPEVFKFIIW